MSIYPNPVASITNISIKMEQDGYYHLAISDLQGRTVKETEKSFYSEGKHNTKLQLESLDAGIYSVRILKEDVIISTTKMIKL